MKCEDLEQVEYETADGGVAIGWVLSVIGRGNRRRRRQVPIPAALVDELGSELARHGFERQVGVASDRGIHVMARFDTGLEEPVPWSASGLYQAIKAFLAQAAARLEGVEPQQLRKASTHWLRHTHGRHALQGGEGQTPVPIQVVQTQAAAGVERRAVIAMQMPATPDQHRFDAALLFELRAPHSASASLSVLEDLAGGLLRRIAPGAVIDAMFLGARGCF